ALWRCVYPNEKPWMPEQLASPQRMFPGGQFVALDRETHRVVGMSASLIVRWECYDDFDNWEDFTADGMFTNHDSVHGRTVYGAEVIVDPTLQGHGIGGKLYAARRELIERLGLPRIRGGARLRSYHSYARRMSAAHYVVTAVHGESDDQPPSSTPPGGFHVRAVAPPSRGEDPETLGSAPLVEWLTPKLVEPHHVADRPIHFLHKDVAAQQLRTGSRR